MVVNPCVDDWDDVDDRLPDDEDAKRLSPPDYLSRFVGSELQAYFNQSCEGKFDFNDDGRHVLHQLAEDFRLKSFTFSVTLWLEAQWLTYKCVQNGLNVRTTKIRPPNATVLSMACKQPWKAKGCQPKDQLFIVEQLLEWKCDPNLVSNRGDTVLMEVAGAGHVNMFKYWYGRIVEQRWRCDLEAVNIDGRNLYSIAGLSHTRGKRRYINQEIKMMVRHLAKLGYLTPAGLATHSTAWRGGRPREEDRDASGALESSSSDS